MSTTNNRLIVPALGRVYSSLHDFAETLLRVTAGLILIVHGAPKIVDPMANIGMVEGLGFYPGVVFSPLLALTEVVGGLFLAIGFLTRPAAFAATFVLLVTVWFHWVTLGQGYAGAEKSILWAAMTFYFVIRGGNAQSVDARLGRTF
ncbi:DoxX family protein [Aureimonas mangrovi]|uniref:DoxX family protein n=1 Tax=Aureimonas mangrovi TaxID=2758041 RepID=UPI00163DA559|nr:DoxX family protein [Aureimonas mangrovi]